MFSQYTHAVRLLFVFLIVGYVLAAAQGAVLKEDQDFQFAAQLAERGMHDLAALQFIKFAEQYPTSPQAPAAIFHAARSYEANNQTGNAAETYLRLLLSYPQSEWGDKAFFNRAKLLAASGDHLEAALTFERVRLFKAESDLVPTAMLEAARQYLLMNEIKRAQAAAFFILEKYGNLPIRYEAHYILAGIYRITGQPKSALRELDRIMGERLEPTLTINAGLLRGQVLQALGQYARADSLLESLLSGVVVNDSVGTAAVQLVQSLSSRGLYERAHKAAEKALTLNLNAAAKNRLLTSQADIFYVTGEFRQALSTLEKVQDNASSPQQLIFHQFRMAAVRQKLGQQQRALDAYLTVCDNADSGAAALQLKKRAFLIACDLLCGMQRPGEALRLLRRLYDERPEWRDSILLRRGMIQAEFMQDWAGARLTYGMLLEFHPDSPLADNAMIGMARCYEQEGDSEQAIRFYDQYLKLFIGGDDYDFARQKWQYLRDFAPITRTAISSVLQSTVAEILKQQGNREDLLLLAREQIRSSRDYHRALSYLRSAITAEGKPIDLLELMYWLGICHARLAQSAQRHVEPEQQRAHGDSLRQIADLMMDRSPDDVRAQQILYEAIIADLESAPTAYDRALYLSQRINQVGGYDSLRHVLQYRLADAWYRAGKDSINVPLIQRAANLCSELLKINPQASLAAETLLLQANIYVSLQQPDSAATLLHTCIDRYSNTAAVVEAMWNLAGMLEGRMKFAEAADLYQDLARRFYYASQGQKAQRKYCRALFRQDRLEAAGACVLEHLYLVELQELRFYLQEELDDETLWLAAQIRLKEENPSAAITAVKTYLDLSLTGAHRGEALWTLGDLYVKTKNADAALGHYRALIDEFPQDTLAQMAQLRSAELLFDMGGYQEAKSLYESLKLSAVGAGRQSAESREIVCEYRLGNIIRARTLVDGFKKQYRDRSAEATFLQEDAQFCLVNKDFKAAEDQFKELASKYRDLPAGAEGELGLARLYVVLNRTEDALKVLTGIPNKYSDPRVLALAYVNLGEFYYENRQLENCITAGRKALEYDKVSPERQRALGLLIRIYDDLRLWDNAIGLLREYIENYADAPDHFSRRIQFGVFLVNLKEFERGIATLRDLLPEADSESEAEIQYWIAQAYASWGSLSEAIVEYLKVRYVCRPTKLPWGTTALYEAGRIYVKLGELLKARSLFQQIVREMGIGDQFGRVANERIKEIDALLIREKAAADG